MQESGKNLEKVLKVDPKDSFTEERLGIVNDNIKIVRKNLGKGECKDSSDGQCPEPTTKPKSANTVVRVGFQEVAR